MTADTRLARLAGLLYLLLLPTTGFWYATSRSLNTGTAAGTLAHIEASRTTFEVAIVVGAAGYVDYLILGLVFYRLFNHRGNLAASLLLAFVTVSTSISLTAIARQIDVLSMLDAGDDQLPAQVMQAMHGSGNLFLISNIFSGLWLIPLAWLAVGSGVVPKVLGVLLLMGSIFYLLGFVGPVFDSNYENRLFVRIIGLVTGIPGVIGEMGTALWLLISPGKGHRVSGPESVRV